MPGSDLGPGRSCAGCGRPLSRYNAAQYCQACHRADETDKTGHPSSHRSSAANAPQPAGLGARLRQLREQRRMTQSALADFSGLSESFLSMVERGQRSLNRYSDIIALAAALRVPPAELAPGMPDRLLPDRGETGRGDATAPGETREREREPEPQWTDFRAKMTRLMEERSVGVRELARQAHYDCGYISNIRNGRKLPSTNAVDVLDNVLEANGQLIASAPQGARRARTTASSPSGSMAIDSPEPGPDTIVLNLRLGGKEVIVPISRRFLLRAGVNSFVEAFALDQQFDMINDIMQRSRRAERLTIASPAHLQEILIHLREQWHALVKTDNLLGPRFALAGVLTQISVVEALRSILRDEQRIEVARLGAKYAESAAWLYEDTDNMTQAHSWTSQAMEWAYEGNDERMLAWTIFRRAQQAAAIPDAAQTIGLAQAARRDEEKLATPTRAAIRVQEAYGHALDGNDQAAQRLLDEAHTWAAGDTVGDAREGHGSYCTPGYIEIQRGHCWLATGQPKKAISLYEDSLRTLPTVYQRNRAATLTRLAAAYAADSQPEQAANTAHAALPVARSAGSKRIVGEIKNVGTELIPYRALPAVAARDSSKSE